MLWIGVDLIVLNLSPLITYVCRIGQCVGLEELAHRIAGCWIRIFFVLCFYSHRALHYFLTLLLTFDDCATLLLARLLLHHSHLRLSFRVELLLHERLAALVELDMGH